MAKNDEKEELSEVQKVEKEKAEKDKKFKCEFDVERVFQLIAAARGLHDSPNLANLIGAIQRELAAINSEQKEKDDKEREEHEKKLAEAKAKDDKKAREKAEKEAKERGESYPPPPPTQPRDTQAHARSH